mmetsp:Transcript_18708/g.66641  ORF Transcript_18708/g.66641 Transcript_18708/m.66641 type:complete len:247 (-) Transcript_18708:764-1504(-)
MGRDAKMPSSGGVAPGRRRDDGQGRAGQRRALFKGGRPGCCQAADDGCFSPYSDGERASQFKRSADRPHLVPHRGAPRPAREVPPLARRAPRRGFGAALCTKSRVCAARFRHSIFSCHRGPTLTSAHAAAAADVCHRVGDVCLLSTSGCLRSRRGLGPIRRRLQRRRRVDEEPPRAADPAAAGGGVCRGVLRRPFRFRETRAPRRAGRALDGLAGDARPGRVRARSSVFAGAKSDAAHGGGCAVET